MVSFIIWSVSWRNRQNSADIKKAIEAVNKYGLLLTYPMKNAPLPQSLWSVFFPRSKMRWAWDESADNRVVQIWDLRERLSRNDSVIYLKWYRDRATFLSFEVYEALLCLLHKNLHKRLERNALDIYELLTENSPQTTKVLKQRARNELGLEPKVYDKAMKSLWRSGLLVGRGEVDDGAFPSLNVAAAELVFAKQWQTGLDMSAEKAEETLNRIFEPSHPAIKQLERLCKNTQKKLPKVIGYHDLVLGKKK